jgi:hypothetical protein
VEVLSLQFWEVAGKRIGDIAEVATTVTQYEGC